MDVISMPAVLVNTVSVVLGSFLGLRVRNRFKENLQNALMTALALCTLVIGVSGAITSGEVLCLILCMAIGTLIGEYLHIEDGINRLGSTLKTRFSRGGNDRFTEGFVSACLLFCVGSMTIVGCLEAGVRQKYDLLFAKSLLDFFSSFTLSSAMGIGVLFSAGFVLLFQGALVLAAQGVAPFLSDAAVAEMTCVGSLLIMAIGFNLTGISKLKLMNYLPAIFIPILLVRFM